LSQFLCSKIWILKKVKKVNFLLQKTHFNVINYQNKFYVLFFTLFAREKPSNPWRRKIIMMRKAFSLLALACILWASDGLAATNALLYTDTFENYTNGTPLIDDTNYWHSSSWIDASNVTFVATVQTNSAAAGSTNAANIPDDVVLSNRFQATTSTNVWLHMQSKVLCYDGPTNVAYDTNSTVMFYVDSNGYCVVHNGTSGWETVTQTLSGAAAIRLTLIYLPR
jgi:hypothetical protein